MTDTWPEHAAPAPPAPVDLVHGGAARMSDATVHEDVLSLVGGLTDKMLAAGRVADALRVLRPRLDEVLGQAQAGNRVPPPVAEAASRRSGP